MKNLKDIIESQNFLVNKKLNNRQDKYEYHPTNRPELLDIIIDLLKQGITDLNCIDVSNIEDMSYLFWAINKKIQVKDIDISEWDVSNVTDMLQMFSECSKFNSDLSNWDVSKVTCTRWMFSGCEKFNSDLSQWDMSNVINMEDMFIRCKSFNYDLSDWNISKAEYKERMFDGCDTLKKNNKIPAWYSN